jgi:hypothetical protein
MAAVIGMTTSVSKATCVARLRKIIVSPMPSVIPTRDGNTRTTCMYATGRRCITTEMAAIAQ